MPDADFDKGNFKTTIYEMPLKTLQGEPTTLAQYEGKALLIVNVASKCGLTPQYVGLQKLYDDYKDRGFEVLGFPCNQFGEQEPGTAEEIGEFCSVNYGVTFPMFEKIEVNGPGRHPLYKMLTVSQDAEGEAGDIQWNFEKFLVSPGGGVFARFRPGIVPEDLAIAIALETVLPD